MEKWASSERTSRGRKWPVEDDGVRSCYRRDRDRIMHSTAFRRLQYKTQVFVFHEADFFKTRLTHSLEVAQIGQTIAAFLKANPELVEAIALAHDVGHPPFGHAGERELNAILKDHGRKFEHNIQSLRVVDELEERYFAYTGLNLTWETREGIARHFTFFDEPEAPEQFVQFPRGGLECQIASAADMIAYCTHDLEDALTMGFVRIEELEARPVRIWARISERYRSSAQQGSTASWNHQKVYLRQVIRDLIDFLIRDVAVRARETLEAIAAKHPDDIRRNHEDVVTFHDEILEMVKELKEYLYERVYFDPRTLRMVKKGQFVIRKLFDAFSDDHKLLPYITQERIQKTGDALGVIVDYIAGMTDRHAMDLYDSLFTPYVQSSVLRG